MQVPFETLSVGKKFYRRKSDGTTDIRFVRMKVSAISLTAEPDASFKITDRALKAKSINCVIVASPNNTDGHHDYIVPGDLVLVSTDFVC
jgi:hypothetical protein